MIRIWTILAVFSLLNNSLIAQICDIKSFLDQCPTNDPAIHTILEDFEIRLNGEVITDFPCYEPVNDMDVSDYTQQLIYLQTLRVIYYMDRHMVDHLSWTDTTLYVWMKNKIDGIHIKDGVIGGYCCEVIDGKIFVVIGNPDDYNREFDKKWIGISGNIGFLAHEVRHTDGYPHSSCCALGYNCDDEYNENNLGPFGIQYWLNKSWLYGLINVGVRSSHTSAEINEVINRHLWAVGERSFRDRFCENIPDIVSLNDVPNPLGEIYEFESTATATICEGEAYSFGTQSLTETGTYTEVFSSMAGCDSTVVLTLNVVPEYNETATASIHEGQTYNFGSQSLVDAGTYTEVFNSLAGCDSTFTLILNVIPEYMQTSVFKWVSGNDIVNQAGNYNNPGMPGARSSAVSWTDNDGNLWLFGGWGFDINGDWGYLNDLWKFDISTNEWNFVSGSTEINQYGVYSGESFPGARNRSTSWKDGSGNFWLMGGFGFGADSGGSGRGWLNDVWKFDPILEEWSWVTGDSVVVSHIISTNSDYPCPRYGSSSWSNGAGLAWLYGGFINGDMSTSLWDLGDMWIYNIETNNWTFISGTLISDAMGVYGTKGVPSINNYPRGRHESSSWIDSEGNLWLFGGTSMNTMVAPGINDLWKFNPVTKEWTWITGSNQVIQPSIYEGPKATPGARQSSASWTDKEGNFWLFGGIGGYYWIDDIFVGGHLSDLWKFNPILEEWTYVAGDTIIDQSGVYEGNPWPGTRYGTVTWEDKYGNLWLFGGRGYDKNGTEGLLNDLWKWNPDSTQSSVSISSVEDDHTNSSPIILEVSFSEEVIGFDHTDLDVTNGASSTATTNDNITFSIPINPISDGRVDVYLSENKCTDLAGNGNLASNTFSIIYDATPPSVTISSNEPDPTNSNTVLLLVKFSEEVSGLDQGDLDIENASIQTITTADNITYQLQIVPIDDGIVTVSLPAGITTDLSGNYNLEGDFTINYDSTLPTVVITSNYPDQTNDNPFNIYVTFSERVTGFDHTDLVVNNGISENVLTNDFTRFVVPIIPSSEGKITVLVPSSIATDMAGNSNTASNNFLITYDSTPPTAIISTIENDPTNSGTFSVDIVFSEMVAGFEHSDLEVINGTAGTELTNDNISFSVPISPISDGSVTINLQANRAADIAGNGNSASNEISLYFDSTSPTVVITINEADPTENNPFDIEITFSEVVNGFDVNDLSITNGTAGNLSTVDNIAYSGSITPIDEGLITIAIPENVATDDAGNGNTEAEDFTITYELPNNNPTIEDQSFSVDENSENGTVVGIVIASDVDGDELAFIIEEGNIGNAFTLNGTTGELTVNASSALDFETNPEFLLAVKIFDGNGGTATAIITINLNDIDETPVTGLDDPGRTDIKLYPNPFHNQIIVESSVFNTNNYDLKLYDPVGKLIPIYYTRVKEDVIKIDLPSLKPGMYFLSIKINDEAGIMSVIKQ